MTALDDEQAPLTFFADGSKEDLAGIFFVEQIVHLGGTCERESIQTVRDRR